MYIIFGRIVPELTSALHTEKQKKHPGCSSTFNVYRVRLAPCPTTTTMPYENTCRKCLRSFPLAASLRRHLAHSLPCKQAHYDAFQKRFSQYRRHEQQFRGELTSETREANALGAQPAGIIGEEAGEEGDGMDVYEPRESRGRARVEDVDDQPELSVPEAARGGEGSHGERAWEEGTEEVDPSLLHVRLFPTQNEAGKVYGEDQTVFEVIRNQQESEKRDAHSPFADREEWDLAKWLVKNVGHNATEEFLRLPAVSVDCDTDIISGGDNSTL